MVKEERMLASELREPYARYAASHRPDQLPSGISVTDFVDEQVPCLGVVRVRRR